MIIVITSQERSNYLPWVKWVQRSSYKNSQHKSQKWYLPGLLKVSLTSFFYFFSVNNIEQNIFVICTAGLNYNMYKYMYYLFILY